MYRIVLNENFRDYSDFMDIGRRNHRMEEIHLASIQKISCLSLTSFLSLLNGMYSKSSK
jgi:hypothetical protein